MFYDLGSLPIRAPYHRTCTVKKSWENVGKSFPIFFQNGRYEKNMGIFWEKYKNVPRFFPEYAALFGRE